MHGLLRPCQVLISADHNKHHLPELKYLKVPNDENHIHNSGREELKGILPSQIPYSGPSLKLVTSCFTPDLRFPLHARKKTSGQAKEGNWSSGTVHTKPASHRQALRHYFGKTRHHIYIIKFTILKILMANFGIPWKYAFWYLQ